MFKKYLAFFVLLPILSEVAVAKVVECRIAIKGISSCNPYSMRLIKAKEVKYDIDKKKLISSKILPVPVRASTKVVPTEEMLESCIKVEEPVRFRGVEAEDNKSVIWRRKEDIYSRIEKIRLEREKFFKTMQTMKEEREKKRLEALKLAKDEERKALEEKHKQQGFYTIEKGDTLGGIAVKFSTTKSILQKLNGLNRTSVLKIGKSLTIPHTQKRVNAIATGEYIVESGDNLGYIAKEFNLTIRAIKEFNHFRRNSILHTKQKILLPFPHIMAKMKGLREYGRRKLRVTATAYSSHRGQTDSTPFLAAWNNRLTPGMKVIAVSRDMLKRYGMRNGTKVRIAGLPGIYRVRDKMNKRYRKRIDIYMGVNRRKALRWGRRSVVIHW